MHDYSIDGHPKEKILFVLAAMAIFSTPLISQCVTHVAQSIGYQLGGWKVPAVAIPAFSGFLILHWLFNKYLWRVKWLRRFLLVPDLNGIWQCDGRTVQKKGEPATYVWAAKVTISQSWSKILICLQTDQSSSKSTAATLQHVEGVGYTLLYQYENSPKPGEPELARHTGAVELNLSEDVDVGEGHYFTDQHRNTVGIMKLTRIKS